MTEDPRNADSLRCRLEQGYFLQNVSPGAFDLFEHRQQWRTVVLLDACRFDAFERVWHGRLAHASQGHPAGPVGLAPASEPTRDNSSHGRDARETHGRDGHATHGQDAHATSNALLLPGRLEKRISVASCTEDWVLRCLDRPLPDVVYVSGSPYVSRWHFELLEVEMRLAHLEEVWRDGWDDALHTVPPAAIASAFDRLLPRFGDKRFVLHFMQPHHPYIGPVPLAGAGWRKFFGAMELDVPELEGDTPIEMLEDGKVTREEVLAAYESNLAFVLGEVSRLLSRLPRPIVVTADHGEAFGECGIFGHPCGTALPELVEVPYLVID